MRGTYSALKSRVSTQRTIQNLDVFRNTPFYWQDNHQSRYNETNGHCCFNHVLGLPTKDGVKMPLWDYQKQIFDALFKEDGSIQDRHLYLKKARGIGASELLLRIMLWLCLKDNEMSDAQMIIITGPRLDLSVDLVTRMRQMLKPFIRIDSRETQITVNGCRIMAFPSNHLDSARGLPRMKFIFSDESDFYQNSEQNVLNELCAGYTGKSNCYIALVSTPNTSSGLFHHIEHLAEKDSIYRRLYMDYKVGLGKIFSDSDIKKAQASPSFLREFALAYDYGTGNCFSHTDLNAMIREYSLDDYDSGSVALGCDPAFSVSEAGSKFAVVVVGLGSDGVVRVYDASEYTGFSFDQAEQMLQEKISIFNPSKIRTDGSNLPTTKSIKRMVGDRQDYENVPKENYRWMRCEPYNFATQGKDGLVNLQHLVSSGYFQVHPKFHELISQMRSCMVRENGNLDKELGGSTWDLIDAARQATFGYRL